MRTREFSIVVAIGKDGAIGAAGELPWNLPGELTHFRSLTTRTSEREPCEEGGEELPNSVIMGRKTWESLPKKLPGRLNIVVSRTAQGPPGVVFVNTFERALEVATERSRETFVIGGGELFRHALTSVLLRRIFATRVPDWARTTAPPDTFFHFDQRNFVAAGAEVLPLPSGRKVLREVWIRQSHPADLEKVMNPAG